MVQRRSLLPTARPLGPHRGDAAIDEVAGHRFRITLVDNAHLGGSCSPSAVFGNRPAEAAASAEAMNTPMTIHSAGS